MVNSIRGSIVTNARRFVGGEVNQPSGLWLKRTHRITRSIDFKRARRTGKSYASPLAVLVVARNDLEITRAGVVAGQRVGGAVQRNRAKRQIRAVLQEALPQLAPGWDLILIARQPITKAHYNEIRGAITSLLQRAGIYEMDGNRSVLSSGLLR